MSTAVLPSSLGCRSAAAGLAPANVSDDDLMVTEPLAVVVRAVAKGAVRPGDAAAVVGGGTLGLLALQVLRAHGARVLIVSRTARRFALAHELGAEATHIIGDGPLELAAGRFSGREGVDRGDRDRGDGGGRRPRADPGEAGGRVVLTGLAARAHIRGAFFSVVRREVTISGSMIYQDEFPEAMRLIESGAVRTRPLVTHRFALDAHRRGLRGARAPRLYQGRGDLLVNRALPALSRVRPREVRLRPLRVLVTGGAGFIGSHVVDRLVAAGHGVSMWWTISALAWPPTSTRARRRTRATFALRSCRGSSRRHAPQAVVHLAAQAAVPRSVEEPLFDASVNVLGTINLLDACRRIGVERVV